MRRPFRWIVPSLSLVVLPACLAQVAPEREPANDLQFAVLLSGTESNSPPGTCGCFWLLGGAADASIPVWRSFSGVIEVAGSHTGLVPGTARGLSTILLTAGPRYTLPIFVRQSIHFEALAGAVRGFDADFRRGTLPADTSTAFALVLGASYDIPLFRRTQLRLVDLHYVQTALPNGSDNRQRDIRVGAGIVFRPAFTGLRR